MGKIHKINTIQDVNNLDQAQKDEHFRHLYDDQPNFKTLARLDPDFAILEKEKDLDFTDPKVVMQLTKTLLKLDFGLHLDLPDNRLCPTVKNRHNYILWLKDLLDSTSEAGIDAKRVGMDIGTGASCIYPLLGCVQRPWSFIAVDIDEESLTWAKRNITLNDLDSRIRLFKGSNQGPIFPIEEAGIDHLDFTMTNPPFYTSEEEMAESAAKKNLPPLTACTGAPVEMVTRGGEVEFVTRMVTQSLETRTKVQWYTAMFGFLSSVSKLVDLLHEHKIDNFAVTEFVQGVKTRRWAVAWSFHNTRPTQAACRGIKADAVPKSVLPASTEATVVRLTGVTDISTFADDFQTAISKLDLETWEWDKHKLTGKGRARDKVWARAWRRKRKRAESGVAEEDVSLDDRRNVFGFMVSIHVESDAAIISSRWTQGHDAIAFESFRGFLKATAKACAAKLASK